MEKRLKPTLRENKRYLLLETDANREEIEQAILNYIGSLGLAETGLNFIDNKVIAVNREKLNDVRAAFCLYHKPIKVVSVSGTLKGLENRAKKAKL